MLQEVKDLQNTAVSKLVTLLPHKNELTFKAPTGSGKTRMMADFMNRVLETNPNVIFLVSSLSKGGLAQQNYNSFKTCEEDGTFTHIHSYLINSEISGEEGLFIPTDYNVYVLPRDLYKENSRLAQGGLLNFFNAITMGDLSCAGLGKEIYVIKDECHQATNNLDSLSLYFSKVINFSATPRLSRGQSPDVEITEEAAVEAKLIKHVEMGDDKDSVEDAITKFQQIKEDYRNLLSVNPCLIIQISNGLDAEKEWNETIRPALDSNSSLKWMVIMQEKKKKDSSEKLLCDTNDIIKKTLSVNQWRDYAKNSLSTIDVIIFKMVISEGWDIPRACMLYQVRDTQSKVLDEQVMGRVRRNPRLIDFEILSDKAQNLATTAWVWGVKDLSKNPTYTIKLLSDGKTIQSNVRIKTTRLKPLTEKEDFNITTYLADQPSDISSSSIFDLYRNLNKQNNEVVSLCYDYAQNDVSKWYDFANHVEGIAQKFENYICNYDKSMEIACDAAGNPITISFPLVSYVKDNGTTRQISNWVWCRKDGGSDIPFDSDAEANWANFLENVACKKAKEVSITSGNLPALFQDQSSDALLWGKNFLVNSEIKYEYYANGLHFSYPDFILVDKKGRVHIMEVKSLNVGVSSSINEDEYKEKIEALSKCYRACSKLLKDYFFYIPIYEGSTWTIYRFSNGEKDIITKDQFKNSL